MVVCCGAELAAKVRSLRNHGMEPRYFQRWIGGNFRLDTLQAAVLNVKLPHLDGWSAGRASRAAVYRAQFQRAGLAGAVSLPEEPWAASGVRNHHIYNQFVIRVRQR